MDFFLSNLNENCFGVDIDGTITVAPDQLRSMTAAMVKCGLKVYIITAQMPQDPPEKHTVEGRKKQLEALGFEERTHYTQILMAPGNTAQAVAKSKASLCKTYKVSMMIDNSPTNAAAIDKSIPVLLMKK